MSTVRTCSKGVALSQDTFGEIKIDGEVKTIKRFTWVNPNKVKVQLLTYGGCISVIEVPDKNGSLQDVAVGFSNINDYLQSENPYFGATIGRVANRIKNGEMTVEGKRYTLAQNNGPNHLHGGIRGFDKVVWESYVEDDKVILSYLSRNMEEGYPGDLLVTVTIKLSTENELIFDYLATTNKPTPVNLTNHSYFNLGGSDSGSKELYNHIVTINADKITETDDELIPTGKISQVSGTVYDLRVPKKLGDVIHKVPNSGYDNNFCIMKGSKQDMTFAARVFHPDSGRVMEVYTDQPGIQFYTGNALPQGQTLRGKTGYIQKHGAFCLETQIHPDAINNGNFPNVILYPGQVYRHKAVYKFSVENVK